MAWDDDDKGNSWKSGDQKSPADLDALVRDFQRRLAGLFGGRRPPGGAGGSGSDGGLGPGIVIAGIIAIVAVWALTGFYQIDAAERGVVLRFGAYEATVQPGLNWHLPWPIESVDKVNTDVTERYSYQGSMLTRDENIVLVDLIVQYRRSDPYKYLFGLRSPEDALRDVTASAIRETIGKNDLDFILTQGRAEVSSETQDLIQRTLDSYGTGISIYEVNLQEANFPRDVEASVQDAVKAREDRERMSLEAQAYANDVVPRARGAAARRREDAMAYKEQVVANAEGEADRFSHIRDAYEQAPDVTRERMYLETMQAILASSTKVILDTDGNGNMIYLPLDRLMERRNAASSTENAPASSAPPSAGNDRQNLRDQTAR